MTRTTIGIVVMVAVAATVGCGGASGPGGRASAGSTARWSGDAGGSTTSDDGRLRGTADFWVRRVDPVNGAPETRYAMHGARVELLDAGGAVISSGAVTRGSWELDVPASASVGLVVRVSTTSAYEGAPDLVATTYGDVATWQKAVADGTNIEVPLSHAAPFHAFTIAMGCAERMRERADPSYVMPKLELKIDESGAADHDPTTGVIVLAIRQAQDDLLVGHMVGHHVLSTFGKSDRPVSSFYLEGSWSPGQDLDPRLAFAEAWATWFSARCGNAWKDADVVERPAALSTGPGSEQAVLAAIFDLFDGGEWKDEDQDGVFVDEAALWRATVGLKGRAHVDISDFAALLIADGAIDQATWNRAFAYLGLSLPLPELGPQVARGATVRGAVNAALGQESLRAASAFHRVTVAPGSGPLEVVLTPSSLFDPLKLIVWAPDGSGPVDDPNVLFSQQTVTIAAPVAGEWLIQVRAGEYPVGAPVAGFELRVR